jgi:hypothetical protein
MHTPNIHALSEAKGNGKIILKQLNSLLNPKVNTTQSQYKLQIGEKIITDNTQVSNEFNNFFIESVKNLDLFSSRNDVGLTTIDMPDDQDSSFSSGRLVKQLS